MVLQFVGFLAAFGAPGSLPPLLAGALGAVIAVWMTFLPCFVFIFAAGPFEERLRGSTATSSALSGIGAAVVGVIGNLALWFAITTLFTQTTAGPLALLLPVPGSLDQAALAVAALGAVLVFGMRC